jgi:hypothetical protein
LAIHLRWRRLPFDLGELETADVIAGCYVGLAAEKAGKGLNPIVAPRLIGEGSGPHVCDQVATKIADRLVAHQRLLSRGWSLEPFNPQDGT